MWTQRCSSRTVQVMESVESRSLPGSPGGCWVSSRLLPSEVNTQAGTCCSRCCETYSATRCCVGKKDDDSISSLWNRHSASLWCHRFSLKFFYRDRKTAAGKNLQKKISMFLFAQHWSNFVELARFWICLQRSYNSFRFQWTQGYWHSQAAGSSRRCANRRYSIS